MTTSRTGKGIATAAAAAASMLPGEELNPQ